MSPILKALLPCPVLVPYRPTHVCKDDSENAGKRTLYWHDGEELTLAELARRLGVSKQTMHKRLKMGWDFNRALTEKADGK